VTDQLDWVPANVDMDVPSVARIYDYLLGGGHNFAADRDVVDKLLAVQPNLRWIARANRDFMRRAVSFMVERGVRQFLDLGSGIPTVGHVHEIVQQTAPEARVAYVDHDEVAVAHGQLILAGNDRAEALRADILRPDDVLAAPEVRKLLDSGEPVGILILTTMHFASPERDPAGAIRAYLDAVPQGSWLAISHFDRALLPLDRADEIVRVMGQSELPAYPRHRAEIVKMFGGFELVEPGVVPVSLWRPDFPVDEERLGEIIMSAGVGRKT
jgi:S-adenosyl methyltransferase